MGTQLKAGESTELTSVYPVPATKLHVTHTRLQGATVVRCEVYERIVCQPFPVQGVQDPSCDDEHV